VDNLSLVAGAIVLAILPKGKPPLLVAGAQRRRGRLASRLRAHRRRGTRAHSFVDLPWMPSMEFTSCWRLMAQPRAGSAHSLARCRSALQLDIELRTNEFFAFFLRSSRSLRSFLSFDLLLLFVFYESPLCPSISSSPSGVPRGASTRP